MQKRTREILALVLLGALVVIGLGAMSYYIFVGHNWNVAASNIDDHIGQLDGYTVVLYEGTQTESSDHQASASGTSSSTAGASEQPGPVSLLDVEASYREKGATVFVANVQDPREYRHPFAIAKRGVKLGFMYADNAELRSQVRADARILERLRTTYNVVVTNDHLLCRQAEEGVVKDLSVIICTDERGRGANDEYRGSAFCVNAPAEGEVGAVLISPSGVFTSKVIGRL